MRTASICISGLFLMTLLAACATSDPGPTQDTAPTEAAPASTIPTGGGTGNATPPPPPKQCVSSCSTDSDCQNSCPSESGSVQCCDTATKTCFKSNGSSCPVPPPEDSGAPPTSY